MKTPEFSSVPDEELASKDLGTLFNSMGSIDFLEVLKEELKQKPQKRFSIIASWVNVHKTHAAKMLLDSFASKYHINTFTIRATLEQYEKNRNLFQTGLKWEEIK